MNEKLKKTIYLTKNEEGKVMTNTRSSFTIRAKQLIFTGLNVEKILEKISDDLLFDDDFTGDIYDRLKELINKGYEYEKNKEHRTTIEEALGYFNWQYKKKYPKNDLPILK